MQLSPGTNTVEKARPWLLVSDISFFLEGSWTNVEEKRISKYEQKVIHFILISTLRKNFC